MQEASVLELLSTVTPAAIYAYFAYLLWKRTDRTLTHYETVLDTYVQSIIPTLARIDERTARCLIQTPPEV